MGKSVPEPIGDVLKNVVEGLSQARKKDIFGIISLWPTIVGKDLTRHARPTSLRKGVLQIAVDESAWLYQANLQKRELLEALQAELGKGKIQDIRFKIGDIKNQK